MDAADAATGDMRESAHVPLVEKRRRRHRMAVRHQASAAARYFRDGDDLSDAFVKGDQPLARRQTAPGSGAGRNQKAGEATSPRRRPR